MTYEPANLTGVWSFIPSWPANVEPLGRRCVWVQRTPKILLEGSPPVGIRSRVIRIRWNEELAQNKFRLSGLRGLGFQAFGFRVQGVEWPRLEVWKKRGGYLQLCLG